MNPCAKCGKIHAKCSAHSKRHGGPCGAQPMRGQRVCAQHGGKAPSALMAGARKVEYAKIVRTLGVPRDVAPDVALLEEVHRTAGHVAWLGERVARLNAAAEALQDADERDRMSPVHPLVWGHVEYRSKTGGDDWGKTTVEKAGASVWYDLYARERKHLAEVCAMALKAGIEERRVRLAESQGELMADVIRRIFADLELTPEQAEAAPGIASRHLSAVASL